MAPRKVPYASGPQHEEKKNHSVRINQSSSKPHQDISSMGMHDLRKKMKTTRPTKSVSEMEGHGTHLRLQQMQSNKHSSHTDQLPVIKVSDASLQDYMKPTISSQLMKRMQVSPRLKNSDEKNCTPSNSNNSYPQDATTGLKSSYNTVRPLMKRLGSLPHVDVTRKTCSSTLKEANFQKQLQLNPGGTEYEGTSMKACRYAHCSLNGHNHTPPSPPKPFSLTRRQRVTMKGVSSLRKRGSAGGKKKFDTGQKATNMVPSVLETSVPKKLRENIFVEIHTKRHGKTEMLSSNNGNSANGGDSYNMTNKDVEMSQTLFDDKGSKTASVRNKIDTRTKHNVDQENDVSVPDMNAMPQFLEYVTYSNQVESQEADNSSSFLEDHNKWSSGCSMEVSSGKDGEELAESETKKSYSKAPEMDWDKETPENASSLTGNSEFHDDVPSPNSTLPDEKNIGKLLPENLVQGYKNIEEDGARIFCPDSIVSINVQANTVNVSELAGVDIVHSRRHLKNSPAKVLDKKFESLEQISVEGYGQEGNRTPIDRENIFCTLVSRVAENYILEETTEASEPKTDFLENAILKMNNGKQEGNGCEDHRSICAELEARQNAVISNENIKSILRDTEMNQNTEETRSLGEVQVPEQSLPRTVEDIAEKGTIKAELKHDISICDDMSENSLLQDQIASSSDQENICISVDNTMLGNFQAKRHSGMTVNNPNSTEEHEEDTVEEGIKLLSSDIFKNNDIQENLLPETNHVQEYDHQKHFDRDKKPDCIGESSTISLSQNSVVIISDQNVELCDTGGYVQGESDSPSGTSGMLSMAQFGSAKNTTPKENTEDTDFKPNCHSRDSTQETYDAENIDNAFQDQTFKIVGLEPEEDMVAKNKNLSAPPRSKHDDMKNEDDDAGKRSSSLEIQVFDFGPTKTFQGINKEAGSKASSNIKISIDHDIMKSFSDHSETCSLENSNPGRIQDESTEYQVIAANKDIFIDVGYIDEFAKLICSNGFTKLTSNNGRLDYRHEASNTTPFHTSPTNVLGQNLESFVCGQEEINTPSSLLLSQCAVSSSIFEENHPKSEASLCHVILEKYATEAAIDEFPRKEVVSVEPQEEINTPSSLLLSQCGVCNTFFEEGTHPKSEDSLYHAILEKNAKEAAVEFLCKELVPVEPEVSQHTVMSMEKLNNPLIYSIKMKDSDNVDADKISSPEINIPDQGLKSLEINIPDQGLKSLEINIPDQGPCERTEDIVDEDKLKENMKIEISFCNEATKDSCHLHDTEATSNESIEYTVIPTNQQTCLIEYNEDIDESDSKGCHNDKPGSKEIPPYSISDNLRFDCASEKSNISLPNNSDTKVSDQNQDLHELKSHKRYDQEDNGIPKAMDKTFFESEKNIIFEPNSNDPVRLQEVDVKQALDNEFEDKTFESVETEVSIASLLNISPINTFEQNSESPEGNIQDEEDIQCSRKNNSRMLFFDSKKDMVIEEGVQASNPHSEGLSNNSILEVDMEDNADEFGDAKYETIELKNIKEMMVSKEKLSTQILDTEVKNENDVEGTQNFPESTIPDQGPIETVGDIAEEHDNKEELKFSVSTDLDIKNSLAADQGETPDATRLMILPNKASSLISESHESVSFDRYVQEDNDVAVSTNKNFGSLDILDAKVNITFEKAIAANNVNLLSHDIKEVDVGDADTKLDNRKSESVDDSLLNETKDDNDDKGISSLPEIKIPDQGPIGKGEEMVEEHDSNVEFKIEISACHHAAKKSNLLHDVMASSNDQMDTCSLQEGPNDGEAENQGETSETTMHENLPCNSSCLVSEAHEMESSKRDAQLVDYDTLSRTNKIFSKLVTFDLERDIGQEETRETNNSKSESALSVATKEMVMKEAANNELEDGRVESIEIKILENMVVSNENMNNSLFVDNIEMENEKDVEDKSSLLEMQIPDQGPNETAEGIAKVNNSTAKLKTEIRTWNSTTKISTFYSHDQSDAHSLEDKWTEEDQVEEYNIIAANKRESINGQKEYANGSNDEIFNIGSNDSLAKEKSQQDENSGFHHVEEPSKISEIRQSFTDILYHHSVSHNLEPQAGNNGEGNDTSTSTTNISTSLSFPQLERNNFEETIEASYPKSDLLRHTFLKENNREDAESEARIHKPKYFELHGSQKMLTTEGTLKYQLPVDNSEVIDPKSILEIKDLCEMVQHVVEGSKAEKTEKRICDEARFLPQQQDIFYSYSNDQPDSCNLEDKKKPEKNAFKQSCYLSDDGDGLVDVLQIEKDAFKESCHLSEDDSSMHVLRIDNEHEMGEQYLTTTFEHLGKIIRITSIETNSDQPLPDTIRKPKESSSMKQSEFKESVEKMKVSNRQVINFLPMQPDPEAEKVALRRQEMEERKKAERWMIDYAIRQIIAKLAPARKRKVALLVEAFEAVTPLPVNVCNEDFC